MCGYTGIFRKIAGIFRKITGIFSKPGKCTILPVIFPPRCIQFRCRRCHDQAWPCESFLGSKIFNTVYLVTAA